MKHKGLGACVLLVGIAGCGPTVTSGGGSTYGGWGSGSVRDAGIPDAAGVGTRETFLDVELADAETCAVTAGGWVWCWGDPSEGQLGLNVTERHPQVVEGVTAAVGVRLGDHHSCALTGGGDVFCWGNNKWGQCGIGAEGVPVSATLVIGNGLWKALALGDHQSCALQKDSSLWCWGSNEDQQLGDGTSVNRPSPTQVAGAGAWASVATGYYHSCGVQLDGTLWCWGNNDSAQLGNGAAGASASVPVRVGDRSDWTEVSAGINYTCALNFEGAIWCWGGLDGPRFADSPVRSAAPTLLDNGPWKAVACGSGHLCAVDVEGRLACMGGNAQGALGVGDYVDRNRLQTVRPEKRWVTVAAGANHTCAIDTASSLWCWGRNVERQVGDAALAAVPSPREVEVFR